MSALEHTNSFLDGLKTFLKKVHSILWLLVLILGVVFYNLLPLLFPSTPPPVNEEQIAQKQERLKIITESLRNARQNGTRDEIDKLELDSVKIVKEIYDMRKLNTSAANK